MNQYNEKSIIYNDSDNSETVYSKANKNNKSRAKKIIKKG